jgi:hypothetical protein
MSRKIPQLNKVSSCGPIRWVKLVLPCAPRLLIAIVLPSKHPNGT